MRKYYLKLAHILPTLLGMTVGGWCAWMALILGIFITTPQLPFDPVLFNIVGPLLYSGILVMVFLTPKLRILDFKKKDKTISAFQGIAWVSLSGSLIAGSMFLLNYTAQLTHVATVDALPSNPERYLRIDRMPQRTWLPASQIESRYEGKNNNRLVFSYAFAYPLISDSTAAYWLGLHFSHSEKSSLSDEELDLAYRHFQKRTLLDLEATDFASFHHFKLVQQGDKLDRFNAAIDKFQVPQPELTFVLEPSDTPYEERNNRGLSFSFIFLASGPLLFLLFLPFCRLDVKTLRKQKIGSGAPWYRDLTWLAILVPRRSMPAVAMISDVLILVFLAMVFSGVNFIHPRGADLIAWGALHEPSIDAGEWWRLFTGIFLHGGVMHLGNNLFGLVFCVLFLEEMLSRWRFLWLFLLCGLAGSVVSLWWNDPAFSVGASGAIMGLYGALFSFIPLKVIQWKDAKGFLLLAFIFVGFTFLFGLTRSVDNAAHLGGFIAGIILGPLLLLGRKASKSD